MALSRPRHHASTLRTASHDSCWMSPKRTPDPTKDATALSTTYIQCSGTCMPCYSLLECCRDGTDANSAAVFSDFLVQSRLVCLCASEWGIGWSLNHLRKQTYATCPFRQVRWYRSSHLAFSSSVQSVTGTHVLGHVACRLLSKSMMCELCMYV